MSPKRIILCFDGTYIDTRDTPEQLRPGSTVSHICRWLLPPLLWQLLWVLRVFAVFKAIEHAFWPPKPKQRPPTNVCLLATAIKPTAEEVTGDGSVTLIPQVVYYIGGIGTLGSPQSRVEEAVTGNTMAYKIRSAYWFLVDSHEPGDNIFLFGFSRGAFAARAMGDFVNRHGIMNKASMREQFDVTWQAFVKQRTGSPGDIEVAAPPAHHPRIRCIGVWDTVGSLGPPPLFFIHRSDASTIRKARRRHAQFAVSDDAGAAADITFQALALDERRFDFYPAVWALPTGEKASNNTFAQTWFAGVHSDVGGGNAGGLSVYPFVWMISKIQEHQLLALDKEFLESDIVTPLLQELLLKPWDVKIGPTDYLERVFPWHRLVPRFLRDLLRVAHRHPHLVAGAGNGAVTSDPVSQAVLAEEQKLHWTVVQRLQRTKYLDECPALGNGGTTFRAEQAQGRMETAVGLDKLLMEHFTPSNS